jgi:hypothetical protein
LRSVRTSSRRFGKGSRKSLASKLSDSTHSSFRHGPSLRGSWRYSINRPSRHKLCTPTRLAGSFSPPRAFPWLKVGFGLKTKRAGQPEWPSSIGASSNTTGPGQSALGRRVRMPNFTAFTAWMLAHPGSNDWLEVIAVVGDTPNRGLSERPGPALYVELVPHFRGVSPIE